MIVVTLYPRWLALGERERPRDERFITTEVKESTKAEEAAIFWWVHGEIGTSSSILEAAARAWSCDPVKLGLATDMYSWRYGGEDKRLEIVCADSDKPVKLDVYRLSRPSTS
jgi:hypothetical protein